MKLINTLNHEKDSYGKHITTYSTQDTLTKAGNYGYKVFAKMKNGESVPIWSRSATLDLIHVKYSKHNLILSRTYKKSTPIEILVTDAITDKVILSDFREASRDHQLFYNIQPALKLGTEKVKVQIKDLRKNKTEKIEIDWNQYIINSSQ